MKLQNGRSNYYGRNTPVALRCAKSYSKGIPGDVDHRGCSHCREDGIRMVSSCVRPEPFVCETHALTHEPGSGQD